MKGILSVIKEKFILLRGVMAKTLEKITEWTAEDGFVTSLTSMDISIMLNLKTLLGSISKIGYYADHIKHILQIWIGLGLFIIK